MREEKLTVAFGERVFSDAVMRERLPKGVYQALSATIQSGSALSLELADVIATAMKEWAVSHGATHYTHWFQPMTGQTAEKHEAFLNPLGDGGALLEFSGKHLVRGEPDASSFPSGGLRAAFEARGYTAWDCTSPAFIKEEKGGVIALCIPTAFCSWSGEALDKKTPLLRSMEAVSKQASRALDALGISTERILPNIGAEQEYFLVDHEMYLKRSDLMFAGRTLFGAPPPKGQEMSDQYYAAIHPRVSAFMKDVNSELWRLGVPAKTQHNEAAPAQHELAIVYSTANIACDHNQLVMEVLKSVANRHGLQCLLHEKPFNGLAGSGKHNNWSLGTADGINVFDAAKRPLGALAFTVFFTCVIAAVDRRAGLLQASCAGAGNDNRMGEHEAPPSVISVFIGEDMVALLDSVTDLLEDAAANEKGIDTLFAADRDALLAERTRDDVSEPVGGIPTLRRDLSDRNRTAPFAFTGDKFEFRMPGASQSVADSTTVLNVIVADELRAFADAMGEVMGDIEQRAVEYCAELIRKHGRILFNGNCYTPEWLDEAKRRGLPEYASALESMPEWNSADTIALFERHGVLGRTELNARENILLDTYAKTVRIEAQALLGIVKTRALPAAMGYASTLAGAVAALSAAGVSHAAQTDILVGCQSHIDALHKGVKDLEGLLSHGEGAHGAFATSEENAKRARHFHDHVLPAMARVRAQMDALEGMVDARLWPLPTYADLLYYK